MDRKFKNKQIKEKRKTKTKKAKLRDTILWYSDWQNLTLKLYYVFQEYYILPDVLTSIIITYCGWREWGTTAIASCKTIEYPYGISTYQQEIYLCVPAENLIATCDLNGSILERNTSIIGPAGIDIDVNKSLMYIAGKTHVTLLSLQTKKYLLAWKLPVKNDWTFRGIKVNGNIIYLTLLDVHQIFVCNNDGKVLNKFGMEQAGSKQNEFNNPMGIAKNTKYLYICDSCNHRISILTKDKGIFISQWGKVGEFGYTYSIFYDELEKLFYIGDDSSVQLFTTEGLCVQRIGGRKIGKNMNQFDGIFGICKLDDRLIVSDESNKRMQIFLRNEMSYQIRFDSLK